MNSKELTALIGIKRSGITTASCIKEKGIRCLISVCLECLLHEKSCGLAYQCALGHTMRIAREDTWHHLKEGCGYLITWEDQVTKARFSCMGPFGFKRVVGVSGLLLSTKTFA